MAATNDKLYEFHVANIHSIEIALNNSALAARKAIAEQNTPAIKSFVSLNALLLGAWSENRLRKLLQEKNGVTTVDRKKILSKQSQIDQWLMLIEVSFRKHYKIPYARLDNNLPFSAKAQHAILVDIIHQDLRSIIEVRNKLAHGQWAFPLNNEGTDVEQEKCKLLIKENLPSLQYKRSLLISLSDIIHDLVVSPNTFVRNFDKNYKNIANTRGNINNRSYDNYKKQLIEKRRRGLEKRAAVRNIKLNFDTKKQLD
jgi:hypothetical protein